MPRGAACSTTSSTDPPPSIQRRTRSVSPTTGFTYPAKQLQRLFRLRLRDWAGTPVGRCRRTTTREPTASTRCDSATDSTEEHRGIQATVRVEGRLERAHRGHVRDGSRHRQVVPLLGADSVFAADVA